MIEILYNEAFKRWEVYTPNSVIRAGERQPVFVGTAEAINAYIERCENNG